MCHMHMRVGGLSRICVCVSGWGNCMPGSVILSVGASVHLHTHSLVWMLHCMHMAEFDLFNKVQTGKKSLTLTGIDSLFSLFSFLSLYSLA